MDVIEHNGKIFDNFRERTGSGTNVHLTILLCTSNIFNNTGKNMTLKEFSFEKIASSDRKCYGRNMIESVINYAEIKMPPFYSQTYRNFTEKIMFVEEAVL